MKEKTLRTVLVRSWLGIAVMAGVYLALSGWGSEDMGVGYCAGLTVAFGLMWFIDWLDRRHT